ncbi:nuclear transport factor 2 family protein [uncultured Sphingomonas sp.]|uniref:nuclear transport factor 2 family protein n=1 Tax=uncultured Sphingomonas sp. TaxID=158754 RepID=UPI002609C046|nr:nuclear transport factor 2 family protein [uncultured Sphingomonas sp.]
MDAPADAVRALVDKDRIRELGLLYCRAVDRKDVALLRTLYTEDATDTHGDTFDGPAAAYCDFIEKSVPHMPYSGHHVCNHLIALDGEEADGEIYAIATHVIPDRQGGWLEDIRWVRYIDRYRREADGCWRFAKRIVTYDHQSLRPLGTPPVDVGDGSGDPSYAALSARLFARGARD